MSFGYREPGPRGFEPRAQKVSKVHLQASKDFLGMDFDSAIPN